MPKVRRTKKIATDIQVADSSSQTVEKLEQTLTGANKASLLNAFELAAKRRLGKEILPEDINSVAKRTVEPTVASRILTELSGTTEKETFKVLARIAIGLASSYCKRAALTGGSQGTQLPIILGAYFLNRFLQDSSSTVAQINTVDLPIAQKLVALFDSYWSSLDIDAIHDKLMPRSESASRITFKAIRNKNVYDNTERLVYAVNSGGRVCGKISWDKACGECSDKSTGWVVTLVDGFNEAAFRSGRSSNPNEPFTAVHKGEVKLHNPSRMTLAFAKSWARSALRS